MLIKLGPLILVFLFHCEIKIVLGKILGPRDIKQAVHNIGYESNMDSTKTVHSSHSMFFM